MDRPSYECISPVGTCDFFHGVLSPNPYSTNAAMTQDAVTGSINKGLYYISAFSAGVNVGSDWISELKGAGARYAVLHSDANVGFCVANDTTRLIAEINVCTSTPVSVLNSAFAAHEGCHQTYDAATFNSLNGTVGSVVQRAPARIESLVGTDTSLATYGNMNVFRPASDAIINVGYLALDHASGTPIPLWGPRTNGDPWIDLSWDYVRSC